MIFSYDTLIDNFQFYDNIKIEIIIIVILFFKGDGNYV